MRSASQHGSCDCDKPRIRILHISRFYFAMIEGASRIPKGGGTGEDLCGSEVMGLWVMGLCGGVWRYGGSLRVPQRMGGEVYRTRNDLPAGPADALAC